MLDWQWLECVAERDIDLCVLEELHVSATFRSWFLTQVFGPDPSDLNFLGAWHSICHVLLGESDLVALFAEGSGSKAAVLIENKINAQPQPDQAARYRARGRIGIQEKLWSRFLTCITAPQAYLSATADAAEYDVRLSYESVRDWFRQAASTDERAAYRARLFDEAIGQHRRGYHSTPHPGVTKFWSDYWQLVNVEYPQLRMNRPGPIAAGSDWPEFRNTELGLGRRIIHKFAMGVVDLELASARDDRDALADRNRAVLAEGVELVATGKSVSFRLRAPPVDRFADLAAQIDAVRVGLSAAARLLRLSPRIQGAEPGSKPRNRDQAPALEEEKSTNSDRG